MVEHIGYQGAWFRDSGPGAVEANIEAWSRAHEALVADGVENLQYVGGEGLIGDDNEATVDGIHFTDLGFLRMAEGLEPLLRWLLAE